jgi:small subunit ribosomal protein S1
VMPAERIGFGERSSRKPASAANPMAEMLESYLSCPELERGQIVSGTVVRIGANDIVVDIGAKCEGIVTERDLQQLAPADRDAIKVGDEILVSVVNPEDAGGNILLSISRALLERDWYTAQQVLQNQEVVERQVVGCNKGGAIVQFGKIRGFVPGSQLAVSRVAEAKSAGADDDSRWASVVGETLTLKVIEVDQKRNRLILSERAAMRDRRKSQRERMLGELKEGDVRSGKVINLADFGAFVDIGGVDGLVHLSELSWKRISHPKEVVEVGQQVRVYVLKIDQDRQRVALSIKRLLPDPWDSAEERYKEGQLVEGVITRLAKWGAFASIVGDEGIEGLIHISEISDMHIAHPREILKPDQVITLRVIGLDSQHHRLSLSLKQVADGELMEEDWKTLLETNQAESQGSLSVSLSQAIEQSEDFPREGISDTAREGAPS